MPSPLVEKGQRASRNIFTQSLGEILLPRDTKFEVASETVKNGIRTLLLRIVK